MTEYTIVTRSDGSNSLRIKSDQLIQAQDYVQGVVENDKQIIITDYFIGDLQDEKQEGGYYYKWYLLKSFRQSISDSPKRQEEIDEHTGRIGTSEDGMCELSSDLDQRIKDLEDALCELSGDTPTTTTEE